MPSITDSIGRVLGGRYRLVTALGTGASAHVYLADDVSLHRRVAIKVLHPALSGDQAFLKRFRAEARAVAALNHPNILQVYDWGEEENEPYLVLEYLAGGSLRQIYDTGVLLTPEQAVQVGLQAAAALEYAHRRGLVHRDIKPANLLFDADRRLRIADFGLARALAEAAWTEPEGAILGTARYAAPEQVEGFVLDGKADVYALALVLYEGVTGEAPFIGDTTVSTLMARMDTLLPEHEALGPLNDVLVWAAAPEPSERFDATQLSLRLQALAVALPTPAPLPIVESVPVDEAHDVDSVMVRPARRPIDDGSDLTELGAPALLASPKSSGASPEGTVARGRRRWPWLVALGVLVAALVGAGVALAAQTKLFTASHPVPTLVGKTVPQAQVAVRADHFTVRVTGHPTSITVGAGLIISQQPTPRAKGKPVTAKEGSTIGVLVSAGPPPVAIPNLTTFTNCNDAIQALKAVHLVGVCPPTAAQYSSTVVAGAILSSTPAGTAPYGSTVTIVTSKGHAPVAIPGGDRGHLHLRHGRRRPHRRRVRARPEANEPTTASVPHRTGDQHHPGPAAGPQPFGSKVVVNISLGPQPVIIPNVT